MEKLIGRNVTMVVEPGMINVGYAKGDIIMVEPCAVRGNETNALFLLASKGRSGNTLYSLSTAGLELVQNSEDGEFSNVICLASSEAGHCAKTAVALRKLADKLDVLELENATATTFDA